MNTDELIKRIRYFRIKSNFSARKLSLEIHKNETYINKIEKNLFNIPLSVLFDIIQALGISYEEFFSDNYMSYEYDKEIMNTLNTLPANMRKIFIDLMKNTN